MIVALDLETTGLNPKDDKIIEVALVKFDPVSFKIIEEYSTLVNPQIHIPEINSSITNIYDQDVEKSPIWRDVLQEVSDFIGDCPVLGHNVYFDTSFLEEKGISLEDNIVIDTFLLANCIILGEKSLSLEYLCDLLKIPLEGAHRALNDTKASIYVFQKLIQKLQKLPKNLGQIFSYVVSRSTDSGMNFIHDTYGDTKNICHDEAKFLKLIDKIFPKTTPYKEIHKNSKIESYDFLQTLEELGTKEKRSEQAKMGKMVYDAFSKEKLLTIEAPTGIGKTFAYLIPAIHHSVATGEQVFISTSTKALQDQIYFKDLQFLGEKLAQKFSYSKLKGKRNYIGLSSFMTFFGDYENFSRTELSFVMKILHWVSKTASGELDELEYYGEEFSFLYQINADDALTFSSENPYEEREFAVRARRQARKTNIVVINNNILFQDISGENLILSKLENLVIDEAHNLEDVATSCLELGFSLHDLEENFLSLEKKLGKQKYSVQTLVGRKEKLLFELGICNDILRGYLFSKVADTATYKTCLLKEDFFEKELHDEGKKEILTRLNMLFIEYQDILNSLDDKLYKTISREIQYIDKSYDIIKTFLDINSLKKYICILKYIDRKGLVISYTYLHPGEYLETHLWKKLSSCILTSATLGSHDDFSYISNMLSLDDFTFHTLSTDFDYEKQAFLFIPNNLGSVKNNFNELIFFFRDLIHIARGNILFLFTSYYSIKEMYTKLDKEMKQENIRLYAQSIGGGKQKLLEAYKKNADNSVLIGTNTFWEGVDIPGDKLKYLVIHKIPFMVPTDPIFQGRSRIFSDPFAEYAIPKAIIKLKQGFGRLIRTKTDSGVVIFLDDRIYSSPWGEQLYGAFPKNIKRKTGMSSDFLEILKQSKK